MCTFEYCKESCVFEHHRSYHKHWYVSVRSMFSTSHHQELQERGCAVPVWLDGGSVEESLDKDCVYVLESFDCDCYSVLHGKYR